MSNDLSTSVEISGGRPALMPDRSGNNRVATKLQLQESEYRLPIHWLLRRHGLAAYQRKTQLMTLMINAAGLSGGNALDVGCGDGKGTAELAQLNTGFTFHGIDFSPRAIAFARLMAPHIEFSVNDNPTFPFIDGNFSLVVAREVVEHIPEGDLINFLKEVHRVLSPGGYFLLTTPSVLRRVPEKHFQHFSPEKLTFLLSRAGMFVKVLRGFGWWPPLRVETLYRYVLGLPGLWRLHLLFGTHEMPVEKADCLLVLAQVGESSVSL